MFLSKSPHGIYYLFSHDKAGRRHAVSTRCRHKSDALKFLQTYQKQACEQRGGRNSPLLSAFTAEFLRHSEKIHTPKTARSNRVALSEFSRIAGDVPLEELSSRDVERFQGVKMSQASVWTARKYCLALGAAFETARRWGYISANPFRGIPKLKTPEIQPTFFTAEDFEKLLSVIDDADFKDLVLAAVMTGMRLGELRALQWGEVDFAARVIYIRNTPTFTTKSKKGRVVPMADGIHDRLLARRQRADRTLSYVFTYRGREMAESVASHRLKRAVRKAGLDERLHFHSLRHTFASWLVRSGASLFEVQKLLGHSSSRVTEIYSHLQPENLHGTVNRISVPRVNPTCPETIPACSLDGPFYPGIPL